MESKQISHHKIVDLSFLILKEIIKYLDNIDKLCFTLVCSKWFKQRDRYLILNVKNVIPSLDPFKKSIILKSYSKELESNQDVLYGSHILLMNQTFKKSLIRYYNNQLIKKEIPKEVKIIRILSNFKDNLKDIKPYIEQSNVTHLIFNNEWYIASLDDCIPRNIKKIKLKSHTLTTAINLTDGLEKVVINPYYNIDNVKFPSMMRSLKFRSDLNLPKVLPKTLSKLHISPITYGLEALLDLTNLTSLSRLSIDNIDYIKSLTSLRSLTVDVGAIYTGDSSVTLRQIPPSVRNLKIILCCLSKELYRTIPSFIDSLYINYSNHRNETVDIYNLFYNYNIDNNNNNNNNNNSNNKDSRFDYENDRKWFSLDKLTLKNYSEFDHLQFNHSSLPEGITSLSILMVIVNQLTSDMLPSTLKKLSYKSYNSLYLDGIIPKSVECLEILDCKLSELFSLSPREIRDIGYHGEIDYVFRAIASFEKLPSNVISLIFKVLSNRTYYIYGRRLDEDNFILFSDEHLSGAIIKINKSN